MFADYNPGFTSMTIKSDRWIALRSKLDNFLVSALPHGYSFPISVLLNEGVDIVRLAKLFERQDYVWFANDPALADLAELLRRLMGPNATSAEGSEITGMGLRFKSRTPHPPFPPSLKRLVPVPMIHPFCERSDSAIHYRGTTGKGPSYGLSSYGYDIRLGNKFRVAEGRKAPGRSNMLDFLTTAESHSQDHLFRDVTGDCLELLPGSFALGVSLEYMNVPDNVIVTCMQKSSVARMGCIAFVTPLEPGWRGFITLELYNATEMPMRIYAGMGIMQLLFTEADEQCAISYADRSGKYMDQPAVPVMSKMG